jgi:hypothetical protein
MQLNSFGETPKLAREDACAPQQQGQPVFVF